MNMSRRICKDCDVWQSVQNSAITYPGFFRVRDHVGDAVLLICRDTSPKASTWVDSNGQGQGVVCDYVLSMPVNGFGKNNAASVQCYKNVTFSQMALKREAVAANDRLLNKRHKFRPFLLGMTKSKIGRKYYTTEKLPTGQAEAYQRINHILIEHAKDIISDIEKSNAATRALAALRIQRDVSLGSNADNHLGLVHAGRDNEPVGAPR